MLENIKRTWSRHCYGRGHCVTPLSNTPPSFAGELCSPYVFSTSWNNDQTPQAVGLYMNQKGIKKAFLIGPNYAVGRDMLAGLRLTFQGEVLGQEMTRWPDSSIFRPSFPRPARRSPTPSLRSTRAAPACSSSPSTCRRASRDRGRLRPPHGRDHRRERSGPFLRPLPDEIGAPFQLPDRAEAVILTAPLGGAPCG
jgi:Periplasmic binding protein